MGYEGLGTPALQETGKKTPADIVTLLWTNLAGSTSTSEQIAPCTGGLDNEVSVSTLVMQAAECTLNLANINLVGLTRTGLVYS